MKMLLLLLFFLSSLNSNAGQIALTFDDAPMGDMARYSGLKRTDKLINVLKKYSIKAAFYCNPSKFDKDDGLIRIKKYDQAGHFIANHSFSHPNLEEISVEEYISDIEKAHNFFKQFSNFRLWFRYPFLKHGNTVKKRDRVRTFLASKGYENGYVTIDNEDWYMAQLYANHLRKKGVVNEQKLCTVYSEILWRSIVYFDRAASKYLKRSPAHTLLLHENDLSALCLETLIGKIKDEGWKIISPELAMKDEVYSKGANTLFNNNGQIAALIHEKEGIKLKALGKEEIDKEFRKQRILEDRESRKDTAL